MTLERQHVIISTTNSIRVCHKRNSQCRCCYGILVRFSYVGLRSCETVKFPPKHTHNFNLIPRSYWFEHLHKLFHSVYRFLSCIREHLVMSVDELRTQYGKLNKLFRAIKKRVLTQICHTHASRNRTRVSSMLTPKRMLC